MAKSDSRFEYKAKLGRTDHNLSQPLGFNSACGMLLPIWFDIATPGDSYYMQHDMPLLRSVQLIAPTMVDVKVHFETFFVPFQMIYQPSENVLFSLLNLQSGFYTDTAFMANNNFPIWNYQRFVDDVLSDAIPNEEFRSDAFRLADLLGLSPYNFATGIGIHPYAPSFFPYQLLAYHTIYQYYYRLDDKSEFSNTFCNWDRYYTTSDAVIILDGRMMQIHQRPWDFDYFMSIYRSPIVSDSNMQKILPSAVYSDLVNHITKPITSGGVESSVNSNISAFTSYVGGSFDETNLNSLGSSVLIRQLFANEKLAMITGRTRKNYDSQVLAHYGVNVPHDVKHDLTMVHHDEYDLTVQEVTSLASTDDAPLGELAGKSFSAGNGKQFNFTAPCHGVMMTIFSIEPKKRYIGNFDRLNAVTNAYDLPTPEFDRLGNVPMFRYECGRRNEVSTLTDTDIIGWKERYYYNKRKYPKVTVGFAAQNGINSFGSYFLSSFPFGQSVIGSASGLPGVSYAQSPRPDLENRFYIERGAFDNMCHMPFYYGWKDEEDGENWNSSPWLIYARDPFIVNSHIKCKKVSWMSKDGEPIYNY